LEVKMPPLQTDVGVKLPPRVILIGSHGVGKTTFGSESGNPVFVVTEDGASNIPVPKVKTASGLVARSWEEFHRAVHEVLTEEHEYDTLVIDTLNGAASLLAQYVCKTQYGGRWAAEKGQRAYLAYGEGPKSTAEEARGFLNLLDSIRAKRGMKVLLLSHRGVNNIRNPRLGDYHQFTGDMPNVIWNVFAQWSDISILADYDMAVLPRGENRPGVPEGTTTRVMRCGGSVAEDTKCRVGYEVQEEMNFDAAEFWESIGKDDYTLSEVKGRWDLLTKAQQTKTMNWLGVKNLEEAPIRRLRQINDRLKTLAIEKVKADAVKAEKKKKEAENAESTS
jgi:hypothetical protein